MIGIMERFRLRKTDDWILSIATGIMAGEMLDYEAPRDAPPYPHHDGWFRNEVFHTSLGGDFKMTGPEPCPYWIPPFENVSIDGEPRPEEFVGNPAGVRGIYTLTALADDSGYLCMTPVDPTTRYKWRAELFHLMDGSEIQFLWEPSEIKQQFLVLRGELFGNAVYTPDSGMVKIAPQTHPITNAVGLTTILRTWQQND